MILNFILFLLLLILLICHIETSWIFLSGKQSVLNEYNSF
jgi:hypothetical protein